MQDTKKAFRNLQKKNDLQAAANVLCNIKGVGPAMASGEPLIKATPKNSNDQAIFNHKYPPLKVLKLDHDHRVLETKYGSQCTKSTIFCPKIRKKKLIFFFQIDLTEYFELKVTKTNFWAKIIIIIFFFVNF